MISSGVYRTSNTIRITIPRTIRHALSLEPGNRVIFTTLKPGIVELRNADALVAIALNHKRR